MISKYKQNDYVFIVSMMTFAKVISVRKSGNLVTLWVNIKGCEHDIHAIEGSNIFVVKTSWPSRKIVESPVIRINAGVILMIILLIILIATFLK